MSATKAHTISCCLHIKNPEETQHLGGLVFKYCRKGDCITLSGDLGAGKTVFARGFIQAALKEPVEVTSPTFTLVQMYETTAGYTIWHFDLYRLEDTSELEETGLDEALEHGMTLIEWPELATGWLPDDRLMVSVSHSETGAERTVQLTGCDVRWKELFAALRQGNMGVELITV